MSWKLVRKQQSTVDERLQTKGFFQWPYYLCLKHFFMTGRKKTKNTPHHERSGGNPIQMRFRARSFFFFSHPSSLRLVIYCFQKLIPCSSFRVQAAPFVYRSYHVSVNHGHSHVTHRKNTISSPKDRRARVGEETDWTSLLFHVFFPLSPSIPLGVTVIAASR